MGRRPGRGRTAARPAPPAGSSARSPAGRAWASRLRPPRSDTRSSPPRSMPGSRCATYKRPPRTLIREPRMRVRPGPRQPRPARHLHRRCLRRRRRPVTGISWNKLCLAATGRWLPDEEPRCRRSDRSWVTSAIQREREPPMRGNLVAQTAGSRRAELDVLRPVTPASPTALPTLWICRWARTLAATGLAVAPRGAAPRPGSGRCADPRCQAAAKASPALALGGSPSIRHGRDVAVGYRPRGASRRVWGRPRSPRPLRTAAGDGDLGGPFQRLLA